MGERILGGSVGFWLKPTLSLRCGLDVFWLRCPRLRLAGLDNAANGISSVGGSLERAARPGGPAAVGPRRAEAGRGALPRVMEVRPGRRDVFPSSI